MFEQQPTRDTPRETPHAARLPRAGLPRLLRSLAPARKRRGPSAQPSRAARCADNPSARPLSRQEQLAALRLQESLDEYFGR